MNALRQLLAENDGSLSLMRVCVLLIVCEIVFEHAFLLVHTGQAKPWDWQDLAVLLGTLGMKVAQKGFEQASTPVITTSGNTTPPKL